MVPALSRQPTSVRGPKHSVKAKLVVGQTELDELCEHIDKVGLAAFDFEFIPERTYFPILCLVQVCVEQTPYLVDPFVIKDLSRLWQRVVDEKIRCIFHAGSQDLEIVYQQSGLIPKNIFDTQIGAGFAGYGYSAGYRRLLSDILNVQIAKTESFSDWQSRPLTPAQIDYAVSDVLHLIPLYERIVERLKSQGRLEWAEEECKTYEENEYYEHDRSRAFMRIKGANSLNSRGLAVLREIWTWRDTEAQRINKPPRVVLSDNVMVEIARKPSSSIEDLKNMRGIRPDQPRMYGKAILAAIDKARSLPDGELPTWPTGKVPTKSEVLTGDFLYIVLKYLANEIGLAPEHICTRDELQLVVRLHKERKLESATDLKIAEGWRHDVVGKQLFEILSGESINAQVVMNDGNLQLTLNNRSIPTKAK